MLRSPEESKRTPRRLLTRKDVSDRMGMSMRTVSRMVSDRRLPPPILIGRNVRWIEEEFEAWLVRQPRWGE